MTDLIDRQAAEDEMRERIFQEIVVEYPSYNVYQEYKGKPYFSIKYTKNGQEYIGYGTYKPEVLSEYLKDYFMPSAQPTIEAEPVKHGRWIPVTNGRGGFECENCHHYAPSYQNGVEWLSDYCPHCGAKMDEVDHV